jgi:hypothetical protein
MRAGREPLGAGATGAEDSQRLDRPNTVRRSGAVPSVAGAAPVARRQVALVRAQSRSIWLPVQPEKSSACAPLPITTGRTYSAVASTVSPVTASALAGTAARPRRTRAVVSAALVGLFVNFSPVDQ